MARNSSRIYFYSHRKIESEVMNRICFDDAKQKNVYVDVAMCQF